MKNIKRFVSVLLALMLAISLCACSRHKETEAVQWEISSKNYVTKSDGQTQYQFILERIDENEKVQTKTQEVTEGEYLVLSEGDPYVTEEEIWVKNK